MNKEITHEQAEGFNEIMISYKSTYRLIKSQYNNYCYYISTIVDPFEKDRPMIYPNKEFYALLETYFEALGIKLYYNNTSTTIWTL